MDEGTIIPQGELLHRAIRWISEERVARPKEKLATLVEEASVRFNLAPNEEEWLLNTFARTPRPPPG